MKSQNVIFLKSQKLLTEKPPRKAAYSKHSIANHSLVGYVTAVYLLLSVSSIAEVYIRRGFNETNRENRVNARALGSAARCCVSPYLPIDS